MTTTLIFKQRYDGFSFYPLVPPKHSRQGVTSGGQMV
jgi:hypothetical protein